MQRKHHIKVNCLLSYVLGIYPRCFPALFSVFVFKLFFYYRTCGICKQPTRACTCHWDNKLRGGACLFVTIVFMYLFSLANGSSIFLYSCVSTHGALPASWPYPSFLRIKRDDCQYLQAFFSFLPALLFSLPVPFRPCCVPMWQCVCASLSFIYIKPRRVCALFGVFLPSVARKVCEAC